MWNPRILYDYWVLSKQSPIDNRMRYRAKVLETVRICKQHRGLDHPKETLSLGSFCKEPQKEAALCKYQREEDYDQEMVDFLESHKSWLNFLSELGLNTCREAKRYEDIEDLTRLLSRTFYSVFFHVMM